MLAPNQIQEIVNAQHALNKVAAGVEYLDKDLDFKLAAGIEAVEAIDHSAWKWWKGTEDDIPQMQMELVDILHFIVSDVLTWMYQDIKLSGNEQPTDEAFLATAATNVLNLLETEGRKYDTFTATTFHGFLHEVTRERNFNDLFEDLGYVAYFSEMCKQIGLTQEELHYQYVAKNVLNLFRQANGYKEGTYIKNKWLDGTCEDNEFLVQVMNEVKGTADFNMEFLTKALDDHYQVMKEKFSD